MELLWCPSRGPVLPQEVSLRRQFRPYWPTPNPESGRWPAWARAQHEVLDHQVDQTEQLADHNVPRFARQSPQN